MSRHIRIWSFGDVDRSGKVRWVANELGYDVEEVRLRPGEQSADPYRELNPYEQVPTAELDGKILIESSAICLLLAERHPEARLIPVGREERDLFWQSVHVSGASLEIPVVNYYLSQVGFIDGRWAELWREPLSRRLEVFAQSVSGTGYICGDFSLADIFAAYVLRIGVQADLLALEGEFGAYLDRLAARPAAEAARFFDSLAA